MNHRAADNHARVLAATHDDLADALSKPETLDSRVREIVKVIRDYLREAGINGAEAN